MIDVEDWAEFRRLHRAEVHPETRWLNMDWVRPHTFLFAHN